MTETFSGVPVIWINHEETGASFILSIFFKILALLFVKIINISYDQVNATLINFIGTLKDVLACS